jgi:hypothetical protein
MTVAVACHFVPSVDDAAHELRVAFGDPAEREKGGPVCFRRASGESSRRCARPGTRADPIHRAGCGERAPRPGSSLRRRSSGRWSSAAGHLAHSDSSCRGRAWRASSHWQRDRRRFARPPGHPTTRERPCLPAPERISSTPLRIATDQQPTRVLVPCSTVIGRSVFSRMVRQGTPSAVVSSCRPPESESTSLAPANRPSISR